MPGWRENVYYAFGEPPPLEPAHAATSTASSIAEAHRLTAFLDAVASGSLEHALSMSCDDGRQPRQTPPHDGEPASLSVDAAGNTAPSTPAAVAPAITTPLFARLIAEAASRPPSTIVAKLPGRVRAEVFRDIIRSDVETGMLDEPAADLAFALLESGFPMNAERARLAATHVANRQSLYSHGANREWLRVYGRYGFTRDIANAVAKGLALDAETRSALKHIANRLRASGKPSAKNARVRLGRTLDRLDRLTGVKKSKPCDLLPGLRAGFVLDLYSPDEHTFFDAILSEIAHRERASLHNEPDNWLTVAKAQALRRAATSVAAELPYLWDRDRLPEPHHFAFNGRDPEGLLLEHLSALTASKPTKAWLQKANTLAADIGKGTVRKTLTAWTGLLLHTRANIADWTPIHAANALGRAMLWAKIPEQFAALEAESIQSAGSSVYTAAVARAAEDAIASRTLIDHTASAGPNSFNDPSAPFLTIGQDCLPVVKGAIWMLSLLDGGKNVARLEALAMALLEKRHGEFRSLAAANACIGALGSIGTPDAIAALKRIRHHIKDRPVAATTAKALTADATHKGKTSNVVRLIKRR